ncbi:MAG: NUDIX domain-containing protein [Elusimicrobiota bacterium]|jgi:8-oxo-dGTP pyrophosphatase MutT (NUDIX family)|nr:NUDIX domain-containing protein [Elusimicrobiota bacterium]
MLKFVSYAEPRNGNAKNHNTETHNDNKKEFSCGAIVYKKEGGKILFLIVHSKRNNEWGFPKGHIEKGESEKETAKREIFEETGIKEIEFIDDFRYEEIYNISKDKKEKREKKTKNKVRQ